MAHFLFMLNFSLGGRYSFKFQVLPDSLFGIINHHFIGTNGTEKVTSGLNNFPMYPPPAHR